MDRPVLDAESATPSVPLVCAVHPDRTGTSVCSRCGGFMCVVCENATGMCPPCRERTGRTFPLERGTLTVGEVLTFGWSRFKKHWLPLTGAALVGMVLGVIVYLPMVMLVGVGGPAKQSLSAGQGFAFLGLYLLILVSQCASTMGGLSLALAVVQGEAPTWELYLRGLRRTGTLVGHSLMLLVIYFLTAGLLAVFVTCISSFSESMVVVTGAVVVMLTTVLCVLGWAFATYGFGPLEALHTGLAPFASLGAAATISVGRRWLVLGVGVIGLLVATCGQLACCVGVLPATGLMWTWFATAYLGLRRGVLPEADALR